MEFRKKNKKGLMGILLVIGGLFLLVMLGLMMAIGSSTINYVMDIAVPEFKSLGMVGDTNATFITEVAIDPVNSFIQNLTFITGIVYVFGILGIFGLAFAYRNTGDKWLAGLFVSLVLLLVIACIFVSSIYEDIYDDDSEIGTRMKEHTILSFLVLSSPAIMGMIAFIVGIILFSGPSEGFT